MSITKNNPILLEIEIKDFITRIQTSKARKEIYYEHGGKHIVPPSKAKHIEPIGKCKFKWVAHKIGLRNKLLLTDVLTGLPIVKNARAAGTPKYLGIKGNNLYSGFGGYRNRVIMVNGVKDNFRDIFKLQPILTDFPLYLHFTMYNEMNFSGAGGKIQSQDLDNVFTIYIKASQDLMKELGIIPDDNLKYIRKTTYEFIESTEKRLIIKAYPYNK